MFKFLGQNDVSVLNYQCSICYIVLFLVAVLVSILTILFWGFTAAGETRCFLKKFFYLGILKGGCRSENEHWGNL